MSILLGIMPTFLFQIFFAVKLHLHSERRGFARWAWLYLMLIPALGGFFGWFVLYKSMKRDAASPRGE
jgi:hypothetical protein